MRRNSNLPGILPTGELGLFRATAVDGIVEYAQNTNEIIE